ncbi:MAG: deoxyribodipyrimidine photolyase, partial [Pseudomonadota bacterium]
PKGVTSLNTTQARSPLPVGSLANTFSQEALADALNRCETKFNCTSETINTENLSASLVEWAAQLGVRELVTAYPPTGPVYETLENTRSVLENAGINLTYVRRDYDSLCWPHASKGFFKLKTKIPKLLEELGLR